MTGRLRRARQCNNHKKVGHLSRLLEKPRMSHSTSGEDCGVCGGSDSPVGNEILLCDGCDLGVHLECYGLSCIPSGDWFCEVCDYGSETNCGICGRSGGVMKRCADSGWIHVCCGLWTANVSFGDNMRPQSVPANLPSSICEKCGAQGATKCTKCDRATHPYCAIVERSSFELRDEAGFRLVCSTHSARTTEERKAKLMRTLRKRKKASRSSGVSSQTSSMKILRRSKRKAKLRKRSDAVVVEDEAVVDDDLASSDEAEEDDDEREDSLIDDSSLKTDSRALHRELLFASPESGRLRGLGRGAKRVRRGGVLHAALAHKGDAADFEAAFLNGNLAHNTPSNASTLDSRYDDTDDDEASEELLSDWQTPSRSVASYNGIDLCSPSPCDTQSPDLKPVIGASALSQYPRLFQHPPAYPTHAFSLAPPRPPATAKPQLSEAQRMRIEHNRQVALLKRRQRCMQSSAKSMGTRAHVSKPLRG